MKKSLVKVIVLLFLMCAGFSSCELLEGCKTCELVTLTNGVETLRSPGLLTCGEELEEKENFYQTIGNTTTYYDCN